jgi:hypothetical protein
VGALTLTLLSATHKAVPHTLVLQNLVGPFAWAYIGATLAPFGKGRLQ